MKSQRGVSLIIVLISLVIIGFAAIAMLRSTDTSTLIVGNLGFRKAALASGDAGSEVAIAWLNLNGGGTVLHSDQDALGYYASSGDGCDLTGTRTPNDATDNVDWEGASASAGCNLSGYAPSPAPSGVPAGYQVRYVINRMCSASGNPASVLAADGVTPLSCSRADFATDEDSSKQSPTYAKQGLGGGSKTYYRITTRVIGPRNTVRFVQAFIIL
jgi:type IV pilus assembly protein PilX